MVPILLLGDLGKRYGKKLLLDVRTPAEAIRALCANFPDFEQSIKDRYIRLVVGNDDTDTDELHNPSGKQQIKIVPVITGAGGLGKVILGAALIAAAFIPGMQAFTILGAGALGAGSAAITGASIAFSMGVSMVLGGVAQMLAPTPKAGTTTANNEGSYVFNGPVNTSAQGNPVPIGYGRMIVGAQVISATVVAEQIAV